MDPKLRCRGISRDKGEDGVRAGVLWLVVVGDSSCLRSISKVLYRLRDAGAGERVDTGTGVAVGVGGSASMELSTYNTSETRGSRGGSTTDSRAEMIEGSRCERVRGDTVREREGVE